MRMGIGLLHFEAVLMTKTILLVEDEQDLQRLASIILRAAGYEVILASNGAEGIEALRLNPPQLIISDVMMPIMDGIEMLRLVKSNEYWKTIPVILISAVCPDNSVPVMWDCFLQKPVSISSIKQTVNSLIGS